MCYYSYYVHNVGADKTFGPDVLFTTFEKACSELDDVIRDYSDDYGVTFTKPSCRENIYDSTVYYELKNSTHTSVDYRFVVVRMRVVC